MGLPLQADLNPHPYWYRRLICILGAFIIILLLGLLQSGSTSRVAYLNNQNNEFLKTLSAQIEQAQQRIWCMHYVIRLGEQDSHPVNHVCQLLINAKKRGVDVRMVVDRSDPEATYPGPDNSPVITLMQKHSINIAEDELDRTTHTKIFLIDQTAIVGSHNLTSWALTKNRESSILSDDPALIAEIENEFLTLFKR